MSFSDPSSQVGKPKKHLKWLLSIFGIIVLISGGFGAALALVLTSKPLQGKPLSREEAAAFANGESITASSLGIPELSRPVNILILGTIVLTSDVPGAEDAAKGQYLAQVNSSLNGQSDAILLVRFDPSTGKMVALSIPRDSRVEIEGVGIQKINAANFVGGAALSAKTTSALLGNVPIDRFLRVNVGGFGQLIDALGGVDVYVPKRMKYQDDSQHLYINLNEGKQHLDGNKAVQYMRYRHDDLGDIGRVQRQQTLMRSLIEQKLNLQTVARIPEILTVLKQNVDTNLSVEEILAVSAFAAKVGKTNTKMLMAPGRFSTPEEFPLSYWLVNEPNLLKLMATYFALSQPANIADVSTLSPNDPAQKTSTVRVSVQDSLKQPKLAKKATSILIQAGLENVVVAEQPWSQMIEKTQIVAQNGDVAIAQQVRDRLGIGEVVVESTGDLESDVTVRLGKDWLSFKPKVITKPKSAIPAQINGAN